MRQNRPQKTPNYRNPHNVNRRIAKSRPMRMQPFVLRRQSRCNPTHVNWLYVQCSAALVQKFHKRWQAVFSRGNALKEWFSPPWRQLLEDGQRGCAVPPKIGVVTTSVRLAMVSQNAHGPACVVSAADRAETPTDIAAKIRATRSLSSRDSEPARL